MNGVPLGRAVYRRAELPQGEDIHPPDALLKIVDRAAREAGVGIIGQLCCANNYGGSTAFVAVSESQVGVTTVKTDHGLQALVDVFFCGRFGPLKTADILCRRLGAVKWVAPGKNSPIFINRLIGSGVRLAPRLAAVDLYGCDRQLINNRNWVEKVMRQAARNARLEVTQDCFYCFEPHGITGVIVGPAFTMSVHTWPEYGVVCADISSCTKGIYLELLETIIQQLQISKGGVDLRTNLDEQGLVLRGIQHHLMTGETTPALALAATA